MKSDASSAEIVHAFNDMREGWLAWVVEQNRRDAEANQRTDELEGTLEEIRDTLKEHASAAATAVKGLTDRVDNIEALPRKAIRWIIITIGGGVAVNVLSNYFLHQYTAHKVDNAAAQAQQAAAVSTVSAQKVEQKVDKLTSAVEGSNSVTAATP